MDDNTPLTPVDDAVVEETPTTEESCAKCGGALVEGKCANCDVEPVVEDVVAVEPMAEEVEDEEDEEEEEDAEEEIE